MEQSDVAARVAAKLTGQLPIGQLCWIGYPFPIERGVIRAYDTNSGLYILMTTGDSGNKTIQRSRSQLSPIYESN